MRRSTAPGAGIALLSTACLVVVLGQAREGRTQARIDSVAADSGVAPGEAAGDGADPPSAGPRPQFVARELGHGQIYFRTVLLVPAAPRAVYDVVSDYDHLPSYMPHVDSSYVVRRDSVGVVVRQVGTTHFLVNHTVHMTLRFIEHPPHLLSFEILSGDFEVYYGSWEFEPHRDGTRLVHTVTFLGPRFVPHALVRHVLRGEMMRMLPEVSREVRRRGAAAASSAVGG